MSAAAERNKEPILNVLRTFISEQAAGEALEIAAGSGTHAVHFANYFKNIIWLPTDIDLQWFNMNSQIMGLKNIRPPARVDVVQPLTVWPQEVIGRRYDLIVCINMIHITPFVCTEALFAATGRLLKDNGTLVIYGPFAVNGVLTPQSNVEFDKSLRRNDPSWGIRDISELQKLASINGLTLFKTFEMPANNKTVVFRKDHTFHN